MDELKEVKATGEDSTAAAPTTPEGGDVKKRQADKEIKKPETTDEIDVDTPEGKNNAGLHEAISKLFEGEDFSEKFKSDVATIFEAAVCDRVDALVKEKTQELEEKFEAAQDAFETELSETVEKFMEFTGRKFLVENELAIESGLKVELAESLLDGMKSLFAEHNVVVDADKLDTIEEMNKEISGLSAKFTDSVNENAALNEQIVSLKNEIAFKEISEGLADTQVEKLRGLAEAITYSSTEDYVAKVKNLRESFFVEKVAVEDVVEDLDEEVEISAEKQKTASEMSALIEAMSRISSK